MMKRLLLCLALLVGAVNAGWAQMPMPFTLLQSVAGGGPSYKTIVTVQDWISCDKSDGSGSVASCAFPSPPTAGNLVACGSHTGDNGGAVTDVTFDDTFGDSGTWSEASNNPVEHLGGVGIDHIRGWIGWVVVGTPSGGGSTVTVTISGTQYIALFCKEVGVTSGTPTWSQDGNAVKAIGTLPSATTFGAGGITTSSTSSWVFALGGNNDNTPRGYTAGGWTDYLGAIAQTGWWLTEVTDRITTSPDNYDPTFTNGSTGNNWFAIGIAFKAQ